MSFFAKMDHNCSRFLQTKTVGGSFCQLQDCEASRSSQRTFPHIEDRLEDSTGVQGVAEVIQPRRAANRFMVVESVGFGKNRIAKLLKQAWRESHWFGGV